MVQGLAYRALALTYRHERRHVGLEVCVVEVRLADARVHDGVLLRAELHAPQPHCRHSRRDVCGQSAHLSDDGV